MNLVTHIKQKSIFALYLLFIATFFTTCFSTPLNNLWDTQIIHNVYGTDKYFRTKDKSQIGLHLSPYYQHTVSAKNKSCKKVPSGDRLGQWQMMGIFFGEAARPAGYKATPTMTRVKQELLTLFADPTFFEQDECKNTSFRPEDPDGNAALGFYDAVRADYEKLGLRGQLFFEFKNWVGIKIKGGIVDYRNAPNFIITPNDPLHTNEEEVNRILLAPEVRDCIAKELDLCFDDCRHTDFEDTHAQVYVNLPWRLKDDQGDLVCTMVTHLSLGGWLPTGAESDVNKPFQAPTGNDGYTAVTFEGSLGFDFPQSVQLNFGGGLLLSEERDLKEYRVPSSKFQSGIIPWKTSITRKPGLTWYVNASFKGENFIDNVSVYFDYLYTRHTKDSIRLSDCLPTRQTIFEKSKGIATLIEQSCWRNQQANIGFDYRINENLAFGFGLQCHITGQLVYRTTTAIGTIALTF